MIYIWVSTWKIHGKACTANYATSQVYTAYISNYFLQMGQFWQSLIFTLKIESVNCLELLSPGKNHDLQIQINNVTIAMNKLWSSWTNESSDKQLTPTNCCVGVHIYKSHAFHSTRYYLTISPAVKIIPGRTDYTKIFVM